MCNVDVVVGWLCLCAVVKWGLWFVCAHKQTEINREWMGVSTASNLHTRLQYAGRVCRHATPIMCNVSVTYELAGLLPTIVRRCVESDVESEAALGGLDNLCGRACEGVGAHEVVSVGDVGVPVRLVRPCFVEPASVGTVVRDGELVELLSARLLGERLRRLRQAVHARVAAHLAGGGPFSHLSEQRMQAHLRPRNDG